MIKKFGGAFFHFFDRLVDKTRHELSKHPIVYAFIGGLATVLFWRGVWEFANYFPFLTPGVSIVISVVVLIFTGTFVSFFVGEQIIESGLREDKRIDQKTEEEVREEEEHVEDVYRFIAEIRHDVIEIRKKLEEKDAKKEN
jgi:low affinity Fe/Cu permease